jgi:hypothetical protein
MIPGKLLLIKLDFLHHPKKVTIRDHWPQSMQYNTVSPMLELRATCRWYM